jgi:DNA-binding transcriptional MerR regulator
MPQLDRSIEDGSNLLGPAAPVRRSGVPALLVFPDFGSKGLVSQENNGSVESPDDKFDDEDYPAYTMGSAAKILGTTPAFLRSLDEAKLLIPQRSEGGHRRYSRYQLRIAARARELVDGGTALDAACRIIILEDQLAEARAVNAQLHHSLDGLRTKDSQP